MKKQLTGQPASLASRLGYGLIAGVLVAVVLELLNGFCAFLLPPLIILTPASMIVNVLIAMVISSTESK